MKKNGRKICGVNAPRLILVVAAVLMVLAFSPRLSRAQESPAPIEDITAKYHFLSINDTLAILDEEGKLKGYIDVTQPADESDDVLTYDITEGSRDKNQVKFRTERIHGKYYRFSGTVEHGSGREDKDPDYLRLTGNLDIVTVESIANKESIQTKHLTMKSIGKNERPDDN